MGARRPGGKAARAGGIVELLSTPRLALLHLTGDFHPERGERIEALAALGPTPVERRAAVEQVLAAHTEGYVERLHGLEEHTLLDPDTPAGPTSFDAALLSAGLALEAVDRGGFALGRPPGHHALADRAMGFCLVNNVAVAARYAQSELGLERVAIVDFDVHHGNGTEAIFRGDDSVFFVSIHQWPFYPWTSGGPGTNDDTTLNIPLDAGGGDAEYARAFDELVEPAVRGFDPQLVLVSAGFDAHAEDPLADMHVTQAGFRDLAARSAALAPRCAAVLEGGYNLHTLPGLVAAAWEGFGG